VTPPVLRLRGLAAKAELSHRDDARVTPLAHRVTLFGRRVTLFGRRVTLSPPV